MSANVESMFSVRQVPWHGLGTIVENAPTSADAIRLAGLDWNVNKKPIYDYLGKEINGFYANTRDIDNSVLGIVSDKYKIVQNSDAFEFTDSLLKEDVFYETAGSLRNGKQVWLLAKMPEQKILDDKVDPYLCFTNTFDGTGAIKVALVPIRVVCQNTLNVALSKASRTWSTKHMGDMQTKLSEAKHTLGLANLYMEELNNKAIELSNKIITDSEVKDILDNVFYFDEIKDSRRKITTMEQNKAEFMKCYNMSDIDKFRGTAWGVVNAIADMVDHSEPNRMTSTYKENNFGKIISGHPLMDKVYSLVA